MSTATIVTAALLALPFVPVLPLLDHAPDSQPRAVAEFQAVEFHGAGHLTVTAGEARSVTVTADPARQADVHTAVRNAVLVVEVTGGRWQRDKLEVQVHLPALTQLAVVGAAQAEVRGLNGGDTRFVLKGASQLRASGHVDHLRTQFEGASQADLSDLVADSVDLQVQGAAQVRLNGKRPLIARVDSVGSLTRTR